MNHLDNDIEIHDSSLFQALPKYIQNSNFMLPVFKENSTALMCLTDKNKREIIKRELSSLANVSYTNDSKQKLKNSNELLDYNRYKYYLDNLKETSNNNYLIASYSKFWKSKKFLINISNKTIINNSNYTIKSIDYLGNIIIEVIFGNGKKECLLNNKGEVLINYADSIEGPADGVYIVTNKGEKQCYLNGVPISYNAEQINILDKYICNSNGNLIDRKKAIVFGNKGNYSIIDDDEDIVLIQSEDTLKIKHMLDDIDLLMIDEESGENNKEKKL